MPDLLSYQAGSAGQPAFMLRARRARRVLWKAMHFIVCEGFFGKSRAGGALESGFSGPARIYARARRARRVLWEAMRFIMREGFY